jgi:hypothetical protein
MTSPFDYVNSITTTKANMMRDSENDTLSEKAYEPWVVNKALSYFPDTILHANLMNQYHHLDKRAQYECLLNSIRPKKRFAKWVKTKSDLDLECIMNYFGYNRIKAKDAMELLKEDDMRVIRSAFERGGD